MADYLPVRKHDAMRPKSSRNMWIAALCCCLGSFSFGYMIGYTSPAVPDMEWQGILETSQLSWFSSLVAIGAIPGCLIAGQLLEILGRKWTIVVSAVPYIIGWLSIVVATGPPVFYIGRFMTGFATGIVSTAVPVYLTEISSKEMRGFLGALNQLGITFGILIAYFFGLFCNYWQLAALGIAGPLLFGPMMMMMPETPRWLITHEGKIKAKFALAWLRSSYVDIDKELAEMEQNSKLKQSLSFSDFLKPGVLKTLILSVGLMVFQQLSGINAVMFNIVDIFLESGFRGNGNLAAMIVGIVQFVATFGGCLVIDRWGRRFMLISTGLAMCISCFIFAYYYNMDKESVHPMLKYTPLFSLSLFIIAFSLGWGPVPSIFMSEVFSSQVRSVASSITVVSNWILAFMITKNYINMKESFGKDGLFAFFGISILLGTVFVHLFIPETKGESLENIQTYFSKRKVPTSLKL